MRTINRAVKATKPGNALVLVDENPRRRFDITRGEFYREVLLMTGIVYRANRRQVCLLDNGNRSTIKAVVGSVRSLRVEGDSLLGTLHWARDDASQVVRAKFQAGHVERVTIAFEPIGVAFLPAGQKLRTRSGVVEGPARIIKRWSPLDCSIGVRVDD